MIREGAIRVCELNAALDYVAEWQDAATLAGFKRWGKRSGRLSRVDMNVDEFALVAKAMRLQRERAAERFRALAKPIAGR